MSVSKVTVGSALAVQAVPTERSLPPVGPLPNSSTVSEEVPVRPVQDDSLFVRESIGSAIIEDRLDFSFVDANIGLTGCRNKSGKDLGLSIDRPVFLASIDTYSKFADDNTVLKSIDQNLNLSELESTLLQADYDFLMSKIKSLNVGIIQPMQDELTVETRSLQETLDKISEIAAKGDEISKKLDISRVENNLEQRVQEVLDENQFRFDESKPGADVPSSPRSTSTSLIKNLQKEIESIPVSRSESDLLLKLRTDGTALSNVTSRNTSGRSYDDMNHLEKTITCCKLISRIMARTFSKTKFPAGLESVKLNTTIATPRGFIFESNDISGVSTDTSNILERLSGFETRPTITSSPGLDAESFSQERSLKNNNFDSFITSLIQGRNSNITLSQLDATKKNYNESLDFLKYLRAVGFEREACSPQDILLMTFEKVVESFPTYTTALTESVSPSSDELSDALAVSLGCRKIGGNDNITGLFRSIILSSIVDSKYKFGDVDPEEFDVVTEIKTKTNDGTGEKSTAVVSGATSKGRGRVGSTAAMSESLYATLEKRKLIPPLSKKWIKEYLDKASEVELNSENLYLADIFFHSVLVENQLLKNIGADEKIRIPNNATSIGTPAQLPSSVNIDVTSSGVNPITSYPLISVYNSLRRFGITNMSTFQSAIGRLYASIIEKFKQVYSLEAIDEREFFVSQTSSISKNVVYDLIFECLSNCLVWSVNPTVVIDEFDDAIYAISGNLTRFRITGDSSGGTTLSFYEGIRLLKFLRDCTTANGSFAAFAFRSNRRFYDLLPISRSSGTTQSSGTGGFSRVIIDSEYSDSYYFRSFLNFIAAFPDLTSEYRSASKSLAILKVISSILDTSISDLIRIEGESRDIRDALAGFTATEKSEVFKCVSLTSVSSLLLKNIKVPADDVLGFENFYDKNRDSFDVSATKWFFDRSLPTFEKSRIIFCGLPQGFINGVIREARGVDSETFIVNDSQASLNSTPKYFEALLTTRQVQDSTKTYETRIAKFHPFIHVIQNRKIDSDSTSADLRASFDLFIFDVNTRKWKQKILVGSMEYLTSMTSLGLTPDEGLQIVDYHIFDSIYKSVVRTLTGLEIDAASIGSYQRGMTTGDASRVLQIFENDTAGFIPRGTMIATDFLTLNNSGYFEVVPFSKLRGKATDLTNPSDHSLLTKFLQTRAFTKGTLSREILMPSAFERVYCGIFNPEDINDSSSRSKTSASALSIAQLTIKALR